MTEGAIGHEPTCGNCGAPVSVLARPRVRHDGRVELWCGRCPDPAIALPLPAPLELARTIGGSVSVATPPAESPPRRRDGAKRTGAPWMGSAALVLVAVGGAFYADRIGGEPARDELEMAPLAVPGVSLPQAKARAARPAGERPLGVTLDGEPIEDRFPTLAEWVHPVMGTEQPLPANASRRFGAERSGKRPAECGRGHCGVDLSGPRGTPILSVAPGVVAQIHRGDGGRGGRYVRIQHPDDSVSSYFHLDEVADLSVGQEVVAGQAVGTLGRSGIQVSGPHLHFGLTIHDGERLRHIDPVPFLGRAAPLAKPAAP